MIAHRLPLRSAPRAAQAGISLIEMMVAVTLALFISVALTVVFVNMKSAFVAQDGLAQLQDNERIALSLLTSSVEQAGYFPNPLTDVAATDLPAATTTHGTFLAGQSIVGTTGTSPASDTLTTRYAASATDTIADCLGTTNTTGANKVMNNLFQVDSSNELTCSTDGGTTNVTLVNNIKSMSVLYGVDSGADGNVDSYLTATAVTSGGYWAKVKTARITLNFLNPYAGQPGQPATIQWVHIVNLMNNS